MDRSTFQLRRFNSPAGEPHAYVVDTEDSFRQGYNVGGALLLDVTYMGGGWPQLFHDIADTAQEPCLAATSLQALYESLEELAKERPLVLVVRRADDLLADVGKSLLGALAHWEAFVRHARGLSPMYLVLETGPARTA